MQGEHVTGETVKHDLKGAWKFIVTFFRWTFLGLVIGVICGVVGTYFHKLIDMATEFRVEHPFLVWFLPVAGLLTLLLYRLCKVSFSAGTNLIITSVRTNEHIPAWLAPLIFIGTVLSHLFGASVGREGAALQLGGSIGHNLGKALRLRDDDVRVLAMCGMSACFSALFGTPITAAVFVLEVISVGSIPYTAFLPCIVGAYTSVTVAGVLGVAPMSFTLVSEIPELSPGSFISVVILAVLCAALSIVYCTVMHKSAHLFEKIIKNPYIRIAVGGLVMAALTAVFGLYDYNGAGTGVIQNAMTGQTEPAAFLIKMLLTALCVGVGFRGGEIVPTMFIGATFGCVVGPLIGLSADFAAAVALVALFCAVVNCPIASIFLSIELFGTMNLPLFAIAIAVSFVLSGYFGLYSAQKVVYSKTRAHAIDRSTM